MVSIRYNGAAFAVFNMIAMLLQIPIILAYSRGKYPNIPVAVMSSWFLYSSLRNFITAVSWTGDNVDDWWDGKGWCDIDTRLLPAAGNGILLAQLATNIHLLGLFNYGNKRKTDRQVLVRNFIDLAICFVLPIANVAVSTFNMTQRYVIGQYLGCVTPNAPSVAALILWIIPSPILSVLSASMTLIMIFRIFSRGRRATLETVSYNPRMNPGYFIRISLFSLVVTLVVVPYSIYGFVYNCLQYSSAGFQPIPWAHGKPAGWGQISRFPLIILEMSLSSSDLVTPFVLSVILLVLSYIMFICYGTGSAATEFYKDVAILLRIDRLYKQDKGSSIISPDFDDPIPLQSPVFDEADDKAYHLSTISGDSDRDDKNDYGYVGVQASVSNMLSGNGFHASFAHARGD